MVVIVPKTTLHPVFLIRFSTSDIVFCTCKSSRGRSMSQVKCKQVNILPGGTYSTPCDLAEKQLRNNTDPKIVFFIAGIPDICTLTCSCTL
jgi:hypothetical protein